MASEGVKERANTSAGGIATGEPRETTASRSASGRTGDALTDVMGSCQPAIGLRSGIAKLQLVLELVAVGAVLVELRCTMPSSWPLPEPGTTS